MNNFGIMRLGGMQPAEFTCPLPKKFRVISEIKKSNESTVYATPDENGNLIWMDQEVIWLDRKIRRLTCSPSSRASWDTFTYKVE